MIFYIGPDVIRDRIDPNMMSQLHLHISHKSRLFYLVYVMVELVEELVVERDMEFGSRVNPE